MIKTASRIVIGLLLSVCCFPAIASETAVPYPLTPISGGYFTQVELNRAVDSLAEAFFLQIYVPHEIFLERYPLFKGEFIKRLSSPLRDDFRQLEQAYNYKPDKDEDETDRAYKRKEYISRAAVDVRNVLYADDKFFKPYFKVDSRERIMHFHSDVKLAETGEVQVVETIKVYAPADGIAKIKSGIIRSFPVEYKHPDGFLSKVPWHVTAVTYDGSPAKYKIENLKGADDLLTIGDPMASVSRGIHTYTITYTTDRQLRYFKDYDELAWNVTGNKWVFDIDSATCSVELPAGARLHTINCYTGEQGSKASNCVFDSIAPNRFNFHTTARMDMYQGLTIALSFNKGLVKLPGFGDNAKAFWSANRCFCILVIGLLLYVLIGFLIVQAYRMNRSGTVIAEFAPPAGMTPAEIGFIDSQKYTSNLFVSAIVDAAINKYISLSVISGNATENVYKLESTGRSVKGNPFYQSIADQCPLQIVGQGRNKAIGDLNEQLKRSLTDENLGNRYFATNSAQKTLSGAICAVLVLIAITGAILYSHIVMVICLSAIVASILLHILIVRSLNRFSQEGRELDRHIKGFKLFLNTAEANRMNFMNPPNMTPELFEKFLPYAIALGVENEWGKLFDQILSQAVENGTFKPTIHYVGWTKGRGHYGYHHYYTFSSSFSGAVSTVTSPASSGNYSSGSSYSGGSSDSSFDSSSGSSGDGGGGGGGDGW